MDNQSAINIKNVSFPDLSFVSGQLSPSTNVSKESHNSHYPTQLSMASLHSVDLQGIVENKEDEMMIMTPTIKIGAASFIKTQLQTSTSTSTPFGDVDENTMIDLRAKHRRTSSLMNRSLTEFSIRRSEL